MTKKIVYAVVEYNYDGAGYTYVHDIYEHEFIAQAIVDRKNEKGYCRFDVEEFEIK